MYTQRHTYSTGMTLVELVIAIAVVSLIFGGLFALFQSAIQLIGNAKAEAGATALMNQRMEYLRSLPYTDLGTVGGIPAGDIPQTATTTLNGITYTEAVLIEYVDAPDDGIGEDDENGILADYKRVKIEYAWQDQTSTERTSIISNIVPRGIETTSGGGTLRVNVFDALAAPVANADVHIYNESTTSTVDIIRQTNSAGVALFAGAPAAANYEITVSGEGLSTDRTYSATVGNPNPATPHVAVIESQISTMNFQIDTLSDVTVVTQALPVTDTFTDAFDGSDDIATSSGISISGGEAKLAGGAGAYVSEGTLLSVEIAPLTISRWESVSFVSTTTPDTARTVQVYTQVATGTYELVPDSAIAGNSSGFTDGPIDLAGVPIASYPALVLGATLTSEDVSATPALSAWTLSYVTGQPPIGSVPFTLRGNKTIGTTGAGAPVYKYQDTHTTDAGGAVDITGLEWDQYQVSLDTGAYVIASACPNVPYALSPGVSDTLTLTLAEDSTYSLRVRVEDTTGVAINGATVSVYREDFSTEMVTSGCGNAFFTDGLAEEDDYEMLVSASGYTDETVSSVAISGNDARTVVLNAE